VYRLEPSFLDALEAKTARMTRLDLTRSDGQLYVTTAGTALETTLARHSLLG
jgi:hypothetical protein